MWLTTVGDRLGELAGRVYGRESERGCALEREAWENNQYAGGWEILWDFADRVRGRG